MNGSSLTLDFYHDVVCGWCFNMSPRLRTLADEFGLAVRHRTVVLQDDPDEMIARFGSMDAAKTTILGHWEACRAASDHPDAFNIDGMRRAAFDYPHGLPGALACKAAERQQGQDGHWRMFDAIQHAHIAGARNIADFGVLEALATESELDRDIFRRDVDDPLTRKMVEADRLLARRMQVGTVPTVIVRETGARLINGPLDDLRAQMISCMRLLARGA